MSASPETEHPYIIESLRYLAIPIDSVNEDPTNAQIHSERNLQAIQESIRTKGQDQPIVVRKEGMAVIKGHGRLAAMRQLGYTHVAAVVIDESRVSAVERGLADNRTSALSQVDDELLALLAQEVLDADGLLIGWSDVELGRLLGDIDREPSAPVSEAVPVVRMAVAPHNGASELSSADFKDFESTCPRCTFGWNS